MLSESMARSRLEAAGSAGLTPLVGREQEVALLRERWAQVKDGLGQVVLLSGEAGIGKSRLVQVLKEHVAAEPQAWLTPCQCSPYYQNTALYPMIDLLERVALRFEREESPQQKLRKLEGFLVQYGLPLAEAIPSLPPSSPAAARGLCAPGRVARAAEAADPARPPDDFLLRIAAQQPVLFVMEDLHWVDPSTLNCSPSWWIKAPPPASWRCGPSARLQPALDGARAPHPGHAAALDAPPGRRDDGQDGARQAPATRGDRAGRGQDGRRAAVCRGADQDGAGVRPAPGARGALRTDRAAAPTGDSHHAARLADGAAGPPGDREGAGATRGDAGARVFL